MTILKIGTPTHIKITLVKKRMCIWLDTQLNTPPSEWDFELSEINEIITEFKNDFEEIKEEYELFDWEINAIIGILTIYS